VAGTVGALVGAEAGWLVGPMLDWLLSGFFRLFNMGFQAATGAYTKVVGGLLRVSLLVLIGYGGLLYFTYYGFTRTPSGFIPSQDKGYLLVNLRLPDSTSVEHTQQVMNRIEAMALEVPGVNHTVAISGQSLLLNANAPNFGSMYVMLDDFHHRRRTSSPATPSPRRSRRSSRTRSPTAWSTSSAPPRSRAWAPSAASRS
jgi:multidrug efflux pump subunit AcrB